MLYDELCARKEKLSLIGLGYVGLPIAVAFSKKLDVIGFDLNSNKILGYKAGIDPTNEVGNEAVKNCSVTFTDDPSMLEQAPFHIVAVPTPVKDGGSPDLRPLIGASQILGKHLKKGAIVVYESTVYPGAVENTQRDVNIAFMNELALMFDRMGIDTNEVVDGMNTKWNALGFRPGLVGGHCIGVAPYYLTYQSERYNFRSQMILTERKINEGMGVYVAEAAVRQMVLSGVSPISMKVVIMGFTFKKNCNDLRNSKVKDIYDHLVRYGIQPLVCDPVADSAECQRLYNITLTPLEEIQDAQCIILAVAHDQFRKMGFAGVRKFLVRNQMRQVIIDVKGIPGKDEIVKGPLINYWRL